MPKKNIYIWTENLDKWEAIENKSEWINTLLKTWGEKDWEKFVADKPKEYKNLNFRDLNQQILTLSSMVAHLDERISKLE